MSVLALKRHGSNDDSDLKHHHLSLVSRDDDGWSVIGTADLPFFDSDEEVFGGSCRGLVYFAGSKGTVVVCNLTTRMWKVFPPSDNAPLTSAPVHLSGCGLGYDPQSDDYKIIRVCHQYHEGDDGDYGFYGCETYTEVCSFRRRSWKKIETPRACIVHACAIYHEGLCYWTSMLDDNFGGSDHHPGVDDHIMTFDVATEEFGFLSFPYSDLADSGQSRVFEYRGSLCALIHGDIPGPGQSLHITLFRRREDTWDKFVDIQLERVMRPLGFGKSRYGDILYLEGYGRELVAYNVSCDRLEPLGITSGEAALIPACMIAICFESDDYQIPDSTPIPLVDVSRLRSRQMVEESPRKKIKSKDEDC